MLKERSYKIFLIVRNAIANTEMPNNSFSNLPSVFTNDANGNLTFNSIG